MPPPGDRRWCAAQSHEASVDFRHRRRIDGAREVEESVAGDRPRLFGHGIARLVQRQTRAFQEHMVRPSTMMGGHRKDDGECVGLLQVEVTRDHKCGPASGCSLPRTGSSSAHTTVPRRSSSAILSRRPTATSHSPKLVPVLLVRAAKRAPEGLHAPAPLIAVEQFLDQNRRAVHTPLLRVPVDSIAKLDRHLDRGRSSSTSIRPGIPTGYVRLAKNIKVRTCDLTMMAC